MSNATKKTKTWILILATAICCLMMTPALLFFLVQINANKYYNEHFVSPTDKRVELVYHSWEWTWEGGVIQISFVDEKVFDTRFGVPYHKGVTWILRDFCSYENRFLVSP